MWVYVEDGSHTERDEETGEYKTTITYRSYFWFFGIYFPGEESRVTFTYTISKTGLIEFDNSQHSAHYLEMETIRYKLAEEMVNTAKSEVTNAMSGRTIDGVAGELIFHYALRDEKHFKESAEIAHIGGTDIDKNAWFFELIY